MSDKKTVLAVDDEPNNLRALRLDLEDGGYNVLTARDGVEGWEVLNANASHIQAILLDRMMPNMDGMEFMKKLKSSELSRISVIMQTAAAEKEQVVQGIKAGVYYYLTKPYDKDIMLSIVQAAVENYGQQSRLRESMEHFRLPLLLVKNSLFEVRNLTELEHVVPFVSQLFPSPDQVAMGIFELILNAIEHGNLGITYEEKTLLNKEGRWQHEIIRRLALPENVGKKALINYERTPEAYVLTICDEGDGFDWQSYLTLSPERATHNHGRGIAFSSMMSFDEVEYQGQGNMVTCKVYTHPAE